jgi:hypothetical protein
MFWPENRMFYERALSVITTILPSEKSRKLPGTLLESGKTPLPAGWHGFRPGHG